MVASSIKAFDFITLPNYPSKTRDQSITAIMNKGLGLSVLSSLFELSAEYVDIMKLAFGSSRLYSESVLKQHIELANKHDIDIYPGGTFFEVAYLQQKSATYFEYCKNIGFKTIEISDGVIDIKHKQKTDFIKQAIDYGLKVITEVGKKDPQLDDAYSWEEKIEHVNVELEQGAWKVILEARESGAIGIYDKEGAVKDSVLDMLESHLKLSDVIFEAPLSKQQIDLIKRYGLSVNLGNVSPFDILSLASIRQGLRGDTLGEN